MKITLCLIALASALFFNGCSQIQSSVSVFHDLPPTGNQETFVVVDVEEHQETLEFKTYKKQIEEHLIEYGWVVEPGRPWNANRFVYIEYGIGEGRSVSGSVPIFGQTGGGSSYTSGTISNPQGDYANFSSSTYTAPTYGQVGEIPYSKTRYDRFLVLAIKDKKKKNIFEATVISSGESPQVSAVLPNMIEALFKDFPGSSGTTKRVVTPVP